MQDNENNGTKTKICYLITLGTWGGAQKYIYDIATNLPNERFSISLITGTPGLLVEKFNSRKMLTIVVEELGRKIKPLNDINSFFKIIKILQKERPDILHVNSSKGGGIGALAGRIVGIKKIVFTAHGWAFNEDRSFAERLVITFFHWLTIMLSHKTIAVSNAVAAGASKLPFTSKKITMIKNSISKVSPLTREYARILLEEYTGINIPKNTTIIGTVSELNKNKGVSYILEALSILKRKGVSFIFIALGDGPEKENLLNLVEKLNLKNSVFLLGFKENAPSLISGFDIFTLTSITESLGYVLLEAGLAKVPVVASAVGGIPEVIENNVTGILVKPRSTLKIATAIESLLSDRGKAGKMALNLNEKVLREFSMSQMLEKTLLVYAKN
jgi:glycosyltransferase involved in cell wall biosynthesis